MKRVVVTGLGIVSGLGIGIEENWNKILAGENAIDFIKSFDTQAFPIKIASEVKDFDASLYVDKKDIKKYSKNILFALAAADLGLKDANFSKEFYDDYDIGVFVSSGIGGLDFLEDQLAVLNSRGSKRVSAYTMPAILTNMAGANIAIKYGFKGPNNTIISACASGNSSIGAAFEMIRHSKIKLALAGGSEAAISPLTLSAFNNMKAVSNSNQKDASRPFSKDRSGFVIGEGCGILVLEELESALKRKAKIYAEIVGYAETCDAFHITAPNEDSQAAEKALELAIKDAGIDKKQITYINAHGTSTALNDRIETKLIKNVFGEQTKDLYVSSIKGALGHALGAAAALEAVILSKMIETDKIVPTINYSLKDEDCDLNYVPNQYISKEIDCALSNSFGFGGHNSCLVMKKYKK